jgi:excisionase family DNA binding protein
VTAFADADRVLENLTRRVEQLESLVRTLRARGTEPERTAYKVSEVARMIGKKPQTVRNMISDGRLAAEDMGGWFLVPADAVERLRRVAS